MPTYTIAAIQKIKSGQIGQHETKKREATIENEKLKHRVWIIKALIWFLSNKPQHHHSSVRVFPPEELKQVTDDQMGGLVMVAKNQKSIAGITLGTILLTKY